MGSHRYTIRQEEDTNDQSETPNREEEIRGQRCETRGSLGEARSLLQARARDTEREKAAGWLVADGSCAYTRAGVVFSGAECDPHAKLSLVKRRLCVRFVRCSLSPPAVCEKRE